MQRHIFSKLLQKEEIVSMAKLMPRTSQLSTPIYIDDAGTYKNSGHWKRIKFKQNNDVVDMRDWAPMDLEGNVIQKKNLNIELKQKDINEISNFVRNNQYILNKLCDETELEFKDFLDVMIPGGKIASEERKQEQRKKVDKLLEELNS